MRNYEKISYFVFFVLSYIQIFKYLLHDRVTRYDGPCRALMLFTKQANSTANLPMFSLYLSR